MEAFIITLKGHELSEKVSNDCISQAKKFNIQVKIFDAIWGSEYQEHMNLTGLKIGRVKKNKMNLGHYGNFFSHYYLWKKCLVLNEPIIVLEHDGYFIKKIPDDVLDNFVDILKLDCENPYSIEYAEKINEDFSQPTTYIHSIKGIHKRKKCGWYTWGSYGYIIKPSGAKKLIDWVTEHGFMSTDNQIADNILCVSICKPSIVRLHPLYEGEGIKEYSTTSEMGMPINE
jgi:GR25 family glycosyltransferase involved in LPS biosynthesis